MNNFPVLAGSEPRITGVHILPRGLSYINLEAIFTLEWLRKQNVVMKNSYEFDPVLVLRKEPTYKKCSLVQVRWMLYALPFGLRFASVHSSNISLNTFNDMYALNASRYIIIYMNLGNVELTQNNHEEITRHFQW